MKDIIKSIAQLPTTFKKIIIISIDIFFAIFAVYLSYVLRFDNLYFFSSRDIQYLIHYTDFLFIILFFIPLLIFSQFYRGSSRYYEINSKILFNFLIYSLIYVFFIHLYQVFTNQIYSKSVLLIQPFLFFILVLSFRKIIYKINKDRFSSFSKEKVILIGEEEGLNQLKQTLNTNIYEIIGFYDEFSNDYSIPGIKRILSKREFLFLCKKHKISRSFVVYSDLFLNKKSIQTLFKNLKLNFKIYKFVLGELNLNDYYLINNRPDYVDQILEKNIYDYSKIYKNFFENKEILITGGAGSIGKAILEKLITTNFNKIHIIDSSEISIFNLKNYLKYNLNPSNQSKIYYHLTSINNKDILDQLFYKNKIDIVFHAAAYKHVDLAQENLHSLINNNVFGTDSILTVVKKYKIKKFVFISSDKAVNPIGIMGITKKIGEYLTKFHLDKSETEYSIVRFGNVIKSSGSVIPLFMDQIKNGGPLTITHPDVSRYFMTSQMAAQLVLISSTIYNSGNIFVLDMGGPFKIENLAKKLIEIYNNENGNLKNIKIKYIGLKDGEKLHEELALGENLKKTKYKKILIADEKPVENLNIKMMIDQIYDLYNQQKSKELKDFLVKELSVK